MSEYPALHRYMGRNARDYEKRRFTSLRGRMVDSLEWHLLARSLARLDAAAGRATTVLDVPTGTGRMARRLTRCGFAVTGLDVSDDMLAEARRAQSAQAYLVGRAEHLPCPDQAFDAIVSVRLFGHLTATAQVEALAEFRRVARRGAVVFMATDSRWLRARRAWQDRRGRSLEHWTPLALSQIRDLAQAAGFNVVDVLPLLGPYAETRAVVMVPA